MRKPEKVALDLNSLTIESFVTRLKANQDAVLGGAKTKEPRVTNLC